jgi:hypothetical protein
VQPVKINSAQDAGNIGGSYVEFGKQFRMEICWPMPTDFPLRPLEFF